MAEDKVGAHEVTWRQLMPWTHIFRGFGVTLDLNKLLLAAAGIVVMFFGWWLLSVLFTANEKSTPPDWPGEYPSLAKDDRVKAWEQFRKDRQHWNLMHEAANLDKADSSPALYQVEDLADTLGEYEMFAPEGKPSPKTAHEAVAIIDQRLQAGTLKEAEAQRLRHKYALVGQVKPAGRLSVSPWTEDRGPNPYLLVTGQAGIPWEAGYFWEWFTRDQVPVMIEPLIKFVRPIVYFLSPRNDGWSRFYFLLATLWTLLTWSFFGGAITRIAAVQIARNESVGLVEAVRFTAKRFGSYITAPLFPLAFVFIVLVMLSIFGLLHMIPVVGDIFIDGIFWPLTLIAGLAMALALVCLPSWPLMAATVSAEGSDSWEAVSRAYSYVINRPWQCIWYALVAIAYGGVIVFFVGFMSSLGVYMAKWGVGMIQPASREPSFLFVKAPMSFGWRELLLEGAQVRASEDEQNRDPLLKRLNGAEVVGSRSSRPIGVTTVGGVSRWNRINPEAYNAYLKTMSWWNWMGAYMVAFWLGLMFLGVLGFGYAYFWSASTIIYMLLRRDMDAAEMDEVYFEEDEYEGVRVPPPAAAPGANAPVSPPAKPASSLPIIEAPRPAPVSAPPIVPTPAPPAASVMPPLAPTPAPVPEKPPEAIAPSSMFPEKPDGEGTPPVM
jgi:hypothetical protein